MVRENSGPKIRQEQETIKLMITLYCRLKHQQSHTKPCQEDKTLCDKCADLLQYAEKRLSTCRFGEQKTTCKRCPRHCYRRDYRERIKAVMRFAGPRMIIYYPTKALQHIYRSLIRS